MAALKRKGLIPALLSLSLLLTGCADILERSYSAVEPHMATYWENEEEDTLRADSYQDLVNALLLLVSSHSEDGTVRIYDEEGDDFEQMAEDAGFELQHETALGTYMLDYMTYSGKEERGFYELQVHFGYHRSSEEQQSIINVTSTEALPDLLREALEEGRESVTIRIGFFDTDTDGLTAMLRTVYAEEYGGEDPQELPWTVRCYPNDSAPRIIEVELTEENMG